METMRLLNVVPVLSAAQSLTASQAELWPRLEAHDHSSISVVYGDWGAFLHRYLTADHLGEDADGESASLLGPHHGRTSYEYDWSLNEL
jgi:hypothetical protein